MRAKVRWAIIRLCIAYAEPIPRRIATEISWVSALHNGEGLSEWRAELRLTFSLQRRFGVGLSITVNVVCQRLKRSRKSRRAQYVPGATLADDSSC